MCQRPIAPFSPKGSPSTNSSAPSRAAHRPGCYSHTHTKRFNDDYRRGGGEHVSQPPLDVRTLLARWTVGEWVIAVASTAMIVAALLDWTTVSCHDSPLCGVAATPVTG